MDKDKVILFENRELFEDPLTDLIRNRSPSADRTGG